MAGIPVLQAEGVQAIGPNKAGERQMAGEKLLQIFKRQECGQVVTTRQGGK